MDRESALAAADALIAAAVVEEIIPGAVLLVAKDGKVLHEKAFGYAQRYDYGKVEKSEPVSMASNQIFDLASLTKVFATTFGLMILVDEKKVDLEAPVYRYLPDFRGTNKDNVTVRRLLTHSSGLAPWKPLYYHADTARDTYATIRDLPLASPVGQERHYSDLGFMLLGYLIEAVNRAAARCFSDGGAIRTPGPAFNDLSAPVSWLERIRCHFPWQPRSRNAWSPTMILVICVMKTRIRLRDGEPMYWMERSMTGTPTTLIMESPSTRGFFSTASELNVLMTLLLNEGVYEGKRFLSEATVEMFLTKDASFANGLGWAMSTDDLPADELPEGSFGHTGFTGTYALGVRGEDVSIILLTNRQNIGVQSSGNYHSVDPLRREITALLLRSLQRGAFAELE